METIKTVLHHYRFDLSKPGGRKEYDAELARIKKAWGGNMPKCWTVNFHGYHHLDEKAHAFTQKVRDAGPNCPIEIETACMFEDQWNTAPIAGVSDSGLRVFAWSENVYLNKSLREGYWIEDTADFREVMRNTHKCGYCGKQEPAAKGYVFCPHCLDSQYLTEKNLNLLRMVPIAELRNERAELSEAERAHLLPLFHAAQIHGSTERGKARLKKERARLRADYTKTIATAKEKRDAGLWIMDNVPGLLENWIFYSHTGNHCFGWRKPLDSGTVGTLLEKISEFPFAYEIKCEDGRTLNGY